MLDLILEMEQDVEAVSAGPGLKVMARYRDREIERRGGPWGGPSPYRHGAQSGHVVFHGREVPIRRPRRRGQAAGEAALRSHRLFPQDGKMQRAAARRLIRQVSTRHYAGAMDDCLEGHGGGQGSVSRHWKIAAAAELQQLSQRPVPPDLVALLPDGKSFRGEPHIVAWGGDEKGGKHVPGPWHGATGNGTVVRALPADLRERGLNPEAAILVGLDGAKAPHKAVKEVFGGRALIQRCRVHKLRNVLERPPQEKQPQAARRWRGAWAKAQPQDAWKELRAVARWLDPISPGAARGLEEGLEETLTLHRLGINELLRASLSSTHLIESGFSRTEDGTRRVKRWRNGKRVPRRGAAALRVAEAGFRRIRGHAHPSQLKAALMAHQNFELETLKPAA